MGQAKDSSQHSTSLQDEITRLEVKLLELEQKMEHLIQVERNHLIRVKNKENLPDDFLNQGKTYLDLTPEKACKLYNDKDYDFILIDVSAQDYRPMTHFPEALQIPWEEFSERFHEIQSKTIPLLIISEDGTNSVLACQFLAKRGYFNCNNISGGYKFWKGLKLEETKSA